MADILDFLPVRALTLTGAPRSGAGFTVSFFASGTTTPITVYSDATAITVLAQPVEANARGVFPAVYSAGGAVKAVILTDTGATYATVDPVRSVATSASSAADIAFLPGDVAATDVQEAVEVTFAQIGASLRAAGLGVTGLMPLTSNIDDTAIPSGLYRYGSTTGGTFPTGVVKADGGLVWVLRQATGTARMELYPGTTDRVFARALRTTWQTWREAPTAPNTVAEGDLIYRGASDFALLPVGTGGQILRQNTALTAPGWDAPWQQSAAVSLSGAGPFEQAVPTWATRAEVMLRGASLSGTDSLILQLSTSAAYVATGYTSYSSVSGGGSTSTAGLIVRLANAGRAATAIVSLRRITGNDWMAAHQGSCSTGGNEGVNGSGSISLAGPIDGIRINATGTDTFDAGSFVVAWQ